MEAEINKIKLKCVAHDVNYLAMCKDIKEIKNDIKEIKEMLDEKFVTRIEFTPIKSIVYGMVGFILLAFLAAIVGLVIIR